MVLSNNYRFNEIINSIDKNNKPNLFLHVCCGPCSAGVLFRLIDYFNLYIIFYNSNIDTKNEFDLRLEQLLKFINKEGYDVKIIYNEYSHDEYLDFIKGYENDKEGGNRCKKCIELRLNRSYIIAKDYIKKNKLVNNYLCTTLSVSPHKNADLIENIGELICIDSDCIKYLPSDFKKENGFLISIKMSKKDDLYRQNYCGCEFSKFQE